MVEREVGTTAAPSRRGRGLQTVLFVIALLSLGGATAAGYLVAEDQQREKVDERAADTAAVAATATATIVRGAADALGGAGVIVDADGALDLEDFRDYARELTAAGVSPSVALLQTVDGQDRATYESLTGTPIISVASDGTATPAPIRDRYYPVRDIQPRGTAFTRVGFDFGGDPFRGPAIQAAIAAGGGAVTGTTTLAGTLEPGVVILHPVYAGRRGRGVEPVGFVASGLSTSVLADRLTAALTPGTRFQVSDGSLVVASSGEPEGRHVRSMAAEVPGGEWTVTVEPAIGPDPLVARAALATGVAVELGLLALFVVTVRHQRRLDRSNRSMGRAEARSRTLERLASQLSRSLSGAEVAGVVLESLPGLTGAVGGVVTVLSADGEQLELVAATDGDHKGSGRISRVPLEDSPTLTGAVEHGEAVYLSSPLAWRGDAALTRYASTASAVAIVPLMADRVLGLLVVRQPGVRRFSEDERGLLSTVGALAGRALGRSLRYDAEHASSLAFQRASLPPALPSSDGVTVAARYRPAAISAAVGGDWYDVLRLHDGRIVVVVGDVVGHGVSAAASMGQLRTAVRVLASVVPEPVRLLGALAAHVAPIPDALAATMAYGVVDPTTGVLDYVMAGHLPPLVLRAGGTAEFLPGDPWPPLGVSPKSPPGPQSVTLVPGDTLVLYTDGVAERRGESLTTGLERLRAAAAELGDLAPDDLCDALLEAIVPSEDQADDVAMLALRLDPVPAAEPSVEAVNGSAEAARAVDPAALT